MILREDIKYIRENGSTISLSEIADAYSAVIFRERHNDETEQLYNLRKMRHAICFPIVDRGALWYNDMSTEQFEEIRKWREDWLNVTNTLIIPETPKWINAKLDGEVII